MCLPRAWLITAQMLVDTSTTYRQTIVHVFLWFAVSVTSFHQEVPKYIAWIRLVELR